MTSVRAKRVLIVAMTAALASPSGGHRLVGVTGIAESDARM